MSIAIRIAEKDDRDDFVSIWRDYLQSQQKFGGIFPPTQRNLEIFGGLFDHYAAGSLPGVCVMAWKGKKPVAVLLWGTPGDSSLEMKFRPAMGWGTFVHKSARRDRVASKLRELGESRIKELGFDVVLGQALVANEAGLQSAVANGFQPRAIELIRWLGDK